MRIPLILIQIVLLVLWFTVPAFATLPLWLILLPLIVILVMMLVTLAVIGVLFAVALIVVK